MTEPEYWYRYEYTPHYRIDDMLPLRISNDGVLRPDKYQVIKHTPKGVWLSRFAWCSWCAVDGKRFVLKDSRKRFAAPTEAEALESFIRRKERHSSILRGQLEDVTDALRIAKKMRGAA